MLLSNKKIIISLVILTALTTLIFKRDTSNPPSEQSLSEYSTSLNKQLPIVISPEITLVKTKIGKVSPTLDSLDFYYSYAYNKNDVSISYNQLADLMRNTSCYDPMTQELISKGILLRHQFITLDKQLLPLIGISKEVCNETTTNKLVNMNNLNNKKKQDDK